eukprot:NODE_29329_length_449_cov_1.990683.p2 GENE.NODE_29329_length_449_cov_1.990683~~NODE_29329_length_449_cov_1.990683.p2  ORF type:complete len:68 (-),score=4.02 NODE_29329_length_449_cov_1.990683:87-290(-)
MSLVFPTWSWARHIFISVLEYNFSVTPTYLLEKVREWACGWISQKVVKDVFRVVQPHSRAQPQDNIT